MISDPHNILQDFINTEAILKGHFILSSGLHSDTYMQCARVLMYPEIAAKLCQLLANKVKERCGKNSIDLVVSPAMGGVVVGYEMARQLNIQSIFCERVNGVFELRRGFEIIENSRILVVEDVVTTGKSSLETFELVKKFGGNIIAEASLVDRSNDKNIEKKLGVPLVSLLNIDVKTYDSDNLPKYLLDIPAIKPGSRNLHKS